ncbi:MAG: hypothetical protein MJB57_18165 [Gemmatimonadetes bacterium]|nr:hypothetical protein [Gemmatimonadota bacterium]
MTPRGVRRVDELGASRVGCLLSALVLLVAGYVGVEYVGAEIDYRSLSSQVQRTAVAARETPDDGLVGQIRDKAAELGLPASAGAPSIRRPAQNRVTISVSYPDSITFFGRWHWVLDRRIQVDQSW